MNERKRRVLLHLEELDRNLKIGVLLLAAMGKGHCNRCIAKSKKGKAKNINAHRRID
jgi:hypothetical protein